MIIWIPPGSFTGMVLLQSSTTTVKSTVAWFSKVFWCLFEIIYWPLEMLPTDLNPTLNQNLVAET